MMRKFKTWLQETFLPAWAKEQVYADNQALRRKNAALEQEIQRLNAYLDGLETGLHAQRRVVIRNEVKP